MEPDEQLYELAAKELAESPRQGLLIKCMAKSGGEENMGKARYIETRVSEMKEEIREGLKKQKAEEKEAPKKRSVEEDMVIAWVAMALLFGIPLLAMLLSD